MYLLLRFILVFTEVFLRDVVFRKVEEVLIAVVVLLFEINQFLMVICIYRCTVKVNFPGFACILSFLQTWRGQAAVSGGTG